LFHEAQAFPELPNLPSAPPIDRAEDDESIDIDSDAGFLSFSLFVVFLLALRRVCL
jgi:hypothetical protein